MKLGLLSAILPNHTFEEVIDLAAEEGYQAVELACWPVGKAERRYAGVSHINTEQLDEVEVKYILDYVSNKGIQIMALGYYPNALDGDQEKAQASINQIISVIKAASALGVNRVSTFIGKNQYISDDENFDLFMKVWPSIIEVAEEYKVYVGIENCPMYFTKDEWPGGQNLASSPHHWRKMFHLIDSEFFGLSYDPSHLHLQGMDYLKVLHEFKDKIFHIHLKDIKVYQEKINEYGIFTYPLHYMSPKIPGKGGIDWKMFIKTLYEIGYQNCACVEIEDKEYENTNQSVLQAIRDSYNYLCKYFE